LTLKKNQYLKTENTIKSLTVSSMRMLIPKFVFTGSTEVGVLPLELLPQPFLVQLFLEQSLIFMSKSAWTDFLLKLLGMTGDHHHTQLLFYWLRWGVANFLRS
jgi:hypothetical protein